jgi:mannose-6-phosphate isomerase-like protein (cupin superfamily)
MEQKSKQGPALEIHEWKGTGYQPFVICRDWLVALMNWEERFDLSGAGQVERHNATDEVFVLTHGKAILFVDNGQDLQVEEMKTGIIYNVTQGVWHSVLGSKDASWLIVESKDTSEENSEYRQLTEKEWATLRTHLPAWAK